MYKIKHDMDAVIATIPNFLDLGLPEALASFDSAIDSGKIKLQSISYSAYMHWSLGGHGKQYPISIDR